MFENLSLQAKRIIDLSIKISDELQLGFCGTESLLLSMFENDNTVCQFILLEYGITSDEIKEEIKKCAFLRKHDIVNDIYTEKFWKVLNKSEEVRVQTKSKYIYDEHLFYSLLITENTVALKILELLGLLRSDLLKDLNNLFDFEEIIEEKTNNKLVENYLINLTKLARDKKLNKFIGREKYINRIIKVLSKKQKNNPLLIGSAGVGKTAIVEGIAYYYLENDPEKTIFNLDLSSLMAGTKYRGDLEERLNNTLKELNNKNYILFIDEIHNILGAGSSEGSLDIANILKPILSRSDIKCIGATTLDEYYRYIDKDKALARRFQNIYIEEPSHNETTEILLGIKTDYEEYHQVKYSEEIIKYIIESSHLIHQRKMPDKVIDILDEVGYLAKLNNEENITKIMVDEVVFDFLGINFLETLEKIKNKKTFPMLNKYYLKYLLNINPQKTIINLQIKDENIYNHIINEIKDVFNIKEEAVLKINLSEYVDQHTSSAILGAPPGYIGHDNGGSLTEHVIKYPLSVIVVNNFLDAHERIKSIFKTILTDGFINDYKGRGISFHNTIFIFLYDQVKNVPIGFNQEKTVNKKILEQIDEIIDYNKEDKVFSTESLLDKYKEKLISIGYFDKFDEKTNDFIDEVQLLDYL